MKLWNSQNEIHSLQGENKIITLSVGNLSFKKVCKSLNECIVCLCDNY